MADPNNTYGRPSAPILSLSEEAKYKKKCRDLKRRISEIEITNESLVTKLARTKRFIQRARLERAILLEKLEDSTPRRVPGSDGSPSPPPSPALEAYSLEPPNNYLDGGASPSQSRRSASPTFSIQDTPIHDGMNHLDAPGNHLSGAKGSAAAQRGSPAPPGKKAKVPKDPNAPKRPKNAFLLFCEIERDSVRTAAESAGLEPLDIARELGRVWAEMDDESRKPYRDMYDEDRVRYEKEMTVYESSKVHPSLNLTHDSLERMKEPQRKNDNDSPAPRVGGFTAVNRS